VPPTDPTEERHLLAVIQGANVAALQTNNDYLDVGDSDVGHGETFTPAIFDEADDSEPNHLSVVAGQTCFPETNIVDAAAAKLLADKQREEMEANKRKLLHEKKNAAHLQKEAEIREAQSKQDKNDTAIAFAKKEAAASKKRKVCRSGKKAADKPMYSYLIFLPPFQWAG
jgi:hypothetical protein